MHIPGAVLAASGRRFDDPSVDRRLHGVDPTVTLVANSIPYLRGRLQRGESRAARPGQRRPRPPLAEPHQIDRRRCQEVLKVRFGFPDLATSP